MSYFNRIIQSAAVLAAFVVPAAARAQTPGTWVLTPYAAAYLPSADVARWTESENGVSATATLRHKNAFALGGNASYWFADRMAVEFGGAYAFSRAAGGVGINPSGDQSFTLSTSERARVLMATAKLMIAVVPTTNRVQLRLGIGPAIISRGGSAYKEADGSKFSGLTDVGAAMSLCTRVPLINSLALRLRVEDYAYGSKLKFRDPVDPSNNVNFGRRLQNDFMVSAGLQIGFSR